MNEMEEILEEEEMIVDADVEELTDAEEEDTTGGGTLKYTKSTYSLTKTGSGNQEVLQSIPLKCGSIQSVKVTARTYKSLGVSYSSSSVKVYRGTQKGTIKFSVTGKLNNMNVTYTFK